MYALGRNEGWFSDMAKKGLHLKGFGRIFVHFEKGEPKETNYNEIGLYVFLRHLSNYREKALWLREYELGLQQKVQPRKALVETYKCIKETGDFPQY